MNTVWLLNKRDAHIHIRVPKAMKEALEREWKTSRKKELKLSFTDWLIWKLSLETRGEK